jgi:sugar O-acyltransferase (sialic acid O-acetyltransferase NeuD family)
MKPKLLLIGAGGHCKVVLDVLGRTREYDVVGIIDVKSRIADTIGCVKVIGTDKDLPAYFKKGIKLCFITVGSTGDTHIREKLYVSAKKAGFCFPNLVSPDAIISPTAVLGTGNYIAPRATVNAYSRIGDNCIINTASVIEHDCVLGDFVHIGPGAVVNGGVTIGGCSHIGAGSTLIQNISIGHRTIIGAASAVVTDIGTNMIAYGNPCKERKTNE